MNKLSSFFFILVSVILIGLPLSAEALELEVVYPNGGETLSANQSHTILWNHSSDVGRVTISTRACRGFDDKFKCDGTSDTVILSLDVAPGSTAGSYEWTPPKYLITGLYQLTMIGYPAVPNGTSINATGDSFFLLDREDGNYFVDSLDSSALKSGEVIVDPGDFEHYSAIPKIIKWRSLCQADYANVWLADVSSGQEFVRPLSPIFWDENTKKIDFNLMSNSEIYWTDFRQADFPYIQGISNDPVTGKFRYVRLQIQRTDDGQYVVTNENALNGYKKGWYKVRVDVHGSSCKATGLSDYVYVTSVLGEPRLPKPTEAESNTSKVKTKPPSGEEQNTNSADLSATQEQPGSKLLAIRQRVKDSGYIESDQEREVLAREKARFHQHNITLSNRLVGKILLQVEEKGEAWYLDHDTSQRFYLKDGAAAYIALRAFGLGITNQDLESIQVGIEERASDTDTDADGLSDKLEEALGTNPENSDTDADGHNDGTEVKSGFDPLTKTTAKKHFKTDISNRLDGKILLQVEDRGQAWYVHNGKRYYMKDGPQAYQIMRFLSLGIRNSAISQIPLGDFSL